jgi:D-alanyl-D-alanine endopeptidase (penicillin-binding protein 7)
MRFQIPCSRLIVCYNARRPRTQVYSVETTLLKRTPTFRIAVLALAFAIGAASISSAAERRKLTVAQTTATRKAAAKAKPPLYSATRAQERKTTLARARAVAMAREMADTVVPRYKVDASGDLVPDLRAAAAIVYNPVTNEVLWEENSQSLRSIASITKVMTATVFLENSPDLNTPVTIVRRDVFQASTTHLQTNDKVTTGDLLHLLLIASDNAAARALARVSPYGTEGFIDRMNAKAAELGLQSTHYSDPSGLLSENVSSAYDMARLIAHASGDERIASVMQTPTYTVHSLRRDITFHSTNHLLGNDNFSVMAAKTGFISKSGYCLATLLRLPQSDQQVAVVVLGARSNAGRFLETENLFNWFAAKASVIFATATATTAAPAHQD